ncbi:MAG: efflux RND transporter permease subunit [Myxococcota bacterium]
MRQTLVGFSVKHPKLVLAIALLITLVAMVQMPRMTMDTNPKNTLAYDAPVRVWNREVDRTFALYADTIVVGIRNEAGVLNPSTLAKIAKLTDEVRRIPGVAAPDVLSLTTATSARAEGESIAIAPLFEASPDGSIDVDKLRARLNATPMFSERLISKDGRVTAIYAPLEHGADGKNVVPVVQKLAASQSSPEQYYVTGDPVVQETFGNQMFGAMGVLGPLSGAIMLGLAYVMFRSWSMAASVMIVAMLSVTWSMGLIIGLGFPVHIMSSMSPVFLMAIATDSIHVFNEFSWRRRETDDPHTAILETMRVTRRPLLFTDITTAVAFMSLLLSAFAPVRVFGLCVAFGTLALLLLSFSVVPAILALTPPDRRTHVEAAPSRAGVFSRWLATLGARHPRRTLVGVAVLLVASALGMTKLRVNNNQIDWFKESSPVRQADTLLNQWLGGTSLAYIVASAEEADYFKDPKALKYIEGLQAELQKLPIVGKTYSVVDQLKQVNRVLHNDDPAEARLPDTREIVAESLFLISSSNRPSDADNVIDPSAKNVNIWLQLRTWDVAAMREVADVAARYQADHAGPIKLRPAGMAYLNLMWNEEVLGDMMRGFAFSLVAVFAILALNFRSLKWAALSYVPLVLTIAVIYGVIGLVGKDFDMPICVLSCLSLGMAVDFAIHFIARFRQRLDAQYGESTNGRRQALSDASMLLDALMWTAERPGVGIVRNAVLFSGTFSVMLLASLRPYVTVGAFMLSMMVLAAVFTLSVLPAIIVTLGPRFVRKQADSMMPSAAGEVATAQS